LNTSTQSEIFTLFLLHLSELETAAANVGQPQEQPAP